MAFTNLQVDPTTLPRAEDLQLQPMDPAYRREVMVTSAIVFLPLFVASWIPRFFEIPVPFLSMLLDLLPAIILILAAGITWLALKQVSVKGYAMREHDVAYRSGLVFRKTTLLPFKRVQHIEVSSGPLQRKFGLASLKFFTAGGASVDLKMDGLAAQTAEQLRQHILERGGRERGL